MKVMTVSFTTQQLEQELIHLSQSPDQEAMVKHLVSGLWKQLPFLEETLLLRELLAIAISVADPHFDLSQVEPRGSASSSNSASSPP